MPQSVRDGLATLHNALFHLENDPQDLKRARSRFDRTPSPLPSPKPLSGSTTRSQSPDIPVDQRRRRERKDRQFKLRNGHGRSLPLPQFEDLVEDEKVHLWMSDPRTAWTGEQGIRRVIHPHLKKEAENNVKQHWIEQGIWRKKWDVGEIPTGLMGADWKHELPLSNVNLSDSEVDELVERNTQVNQPEIPHKTTKKLIENRNDEKRVKQARDREASRPLPMFLYQVDQARRRILETQRALSKGPHEAYFEEEEDFTTDINSKAYDIVKKAWIKRNIWTNEWTILPGLAWKHEQPIVDLMDESDIDDPISIGLLNTDELRAQKKERENEKKRREERRKENESQRKTRVIEDYYLPDHRR